LKKLDFGINSTMRYGLKSWVCYKDIYYIVENSDELQNLLNSNMFTTTPVTNFYLTSKTIYCIDSSSTDFPLVNEVNGDDVIKISLTQDWIISLQLNNSGITINDCNKKGDNTNKYNLWFVFFQSFESNKFKWEIYVDDKECETN
jgi:hypothetical protein